MNCFVSDDAQLVAVGGPDALLSGKCGVDLKTLSCAWRVPFSLFAVTALCRCSCTMQCPTRAQASCGLRVSCAAWVTAQPTIRGKCGRSKCSACFVALFWKSGVHACTGAAWLARADTGGGAGQSGRVHCSKSAIEAGSGQGIISFMTKQKE